MDNFGSPPPPSPQLSVAEESETQESQPLPSPAGVQTSGNEMHDECEQKIYSRPYMLVKKCVFCSLFMLFGVITVKRLYCAFLEEYGL